MPFYAVFCPLVPAHEKPIPTLPFVYLKYFYIFVL